MPVLERAVDESERELEAMEAEAAQLLDGIKNTVGGLSDLRYGKLANQNLGKQIVKNLNSFVEANTNGGK